MRFGPVQIDAAAGSVLAHSLTAGKLRLKKGRTLTAADAEALRAAGIAEVTVARLAPGDVDEDAAAAAIARALVLDPGRAGLTISEAFTGRVNVLAAKPGVLRIDRAAVDRLNAVDPAITLATVPNWARVEARQMVATVKIIPYAVAGARLDEALGAIRASTLALHPFRPGRAAVILTRTPGFKQSLLHKGADIVAARLASLGLEAVPPVTVEHATAPVADALRRAPGDLVLILGASATSDAADTCPSAVIAAGGELLRFGMPVDPGNLLFLGRQAGRPVVGLPGCARSPALNGADWVLERLAAGLEVTDADIAGMGVGGLLKEIPVRPQPRAAPPSKRREAPRVAAIVLAAGAARRMRGGDKLLEPVAGRPVLRAVTEAALASRAAEVVVVLPPDAPDRRAAVDGTGARVVVAADWAAGMAASLRAGLAAIAERADAVVVLLADMPEVAAADIDRVIAAYDPDGGRAICRAVTEDGRPGHPVLFGRRFFEALAALEGDRGAREVIAAAPEFVADVPLRGGAAVTDLDTPEDWAAWRARSPEPAQR